PGHHHREADLQRDFPGHVPLHQRTDPGEPPERHARQILHLRKGCRPGPESSRKDRKSTRLNSSHVKNSYAVFCLKKKKKVTNLPKPNGLSTHKHMSYNPQSHNCRKGKPKHLTHDVST